jgi:hypothetical protein
LQDHGIEPAPERGVKMSWKTFLAAHSEGLAAADFFTVEVLRRLTSRDFNSRAKVQNVRAGSSAASITSTACNERRE